MFAFKTSDIGTGQVENRERIDFTALRQARRARVFAAMDAHGLDACLFGREANARYLSGVRRLWTGQTRAFAPSCAVVRATQSVHLLSYSASYEGMPEELVPEDVFPVTWNPAKFIQHVMATPGLAQARRVGVDGMSPLFADMIKQALPNAELIPVEAIMRVTRRRKLPGEIACMQTAIAIAESAVLEAARRIAPGVSQKVLQAAYLARMCELGTSQFAQQGTFTAIGPNGALHSITDDVALDDNTLVALAGGVLWNGYEGSLARTWWSGRRGSTAPYAGLYDQWSAIMTEIAAKCRPGATGADVRQAMHGNAARDAAIKVYSVGLGHEGPIAGGVIPATAEAQQSLEADMVLGIRIFVPHALGGYLGEDMIRLTDQGPEFLTTLGHGPLAHGATS